MSEIKIVADDDLMPSYALDGDAGMDLRADDACFIAPYERCLVGTSVKLEMPKNIVALVHPRSGLALKRGITVLNAPGTIDSNYRGEVGVILYNSSDEPFIVERGDRIAQLVFQEVAHPVLVRVESLNESNRGDGGFGSTGAN